MVVRRLLSILGHERHGWILNLAPQVMVCFVEKEGERYGRWYAFDAPSDTLLARTPSRSALLSELAIRGSGPCQVGLSNAVRRAQVEAALADLQGRTLEEDAAEDGPNTKTRAIRHSSSPTTPNT